VPSQKIRNIQIVVILGLLALVSMASAFPFWLESPSRRNPSDPKNPKTAPARPTSTPYPTLPIPAATPVIVQSPTPVFGPGTWVTDFEDNVHNDRTLTPFGQYIDTNCDAYGSTISPLPWTGSSGTNPGSTVSGFPSDLYCAHMVGRLVQQVVATNLFPFAVMELQLAPQGYYKPDGTGGRFDLYHKPGPAGGSWTPNKRLIFDYRSQTPGVTFGVQIIQQDMVTAGVSTYDFYELDWTPIDKAWHTQVVYFPDSPYQPRLIQQYGLPGYFVAWNPAAVGELLYRVVASNTGPVNFDLSLDNIRFD
jgi:hypothetical protein